MIDGIPVVDAVVHAYDFGPDNYANSTGAWIAGAGHASAAAFMPPGTMPTQEDYTMNWTIEEIANILFLESGTDIGVHHSLPLYAFKDGGCSFEKTLEAKERWPQRFLTYAGIDPMKGKAAIEELEWQIEELQPVGIKLYPNSWVGEEVLDWRMDDPEIAFPAFARAEELGLKVVAVHKAIPFGAVPLDPQRVDDIDRAAMAFPSLQFEIVHGGMAFLEETAWQLARFPNVWVNLESTCAMLGRRPRGFELAMAKMLQYGGAAALEKIMWGSGAMAFHPQPLLERFIRDFDFTEEMTETYGLPVMDRDAKAKILGENYARMVGLDLPAMLAEIEGDSFAREVEDNGGHFGLFERTHAAGQLV